MFDLLAPVAAACALHLPPQARLLVAVSGGPDSQALLLLLAQLRDRAAGSQGAAAPSQLWALGVDHGLRPGAAAELQLAATLAERLGVSYRTVSVRVARRGNRLAAARRARYAALTVAADALGADAVALGHQADDQLECLLLHLCRGAGGNALRGMATRRGRWLRPLLHCTRAALAAHLTQHRVVAAQDPSNADGGRARTQLRQQVLPALRALNPAVAAHAVAFAEATQEDAAALARAARGAWKRLRRPDGQLATVPLHALPPAVGRRVLQIWLRHHGLRTSPSRWRRTLFAASQGDASRLGEPTAWSLGTAQVRLSAGLLAYEGRFAASTAALQRPTWRTALIPPGRVALRLGDVHLAARLAPVDALPLPAARTGVAFDADRLHFTLWLRPWQPGDRFRPWGMLGHVKVGDLFTNLKVPVSLRCAWPVVLHGDEVVWVVGLRRASLAAVGSTTRRVLRLELQGALPWPSLPVNLNLPPPAQL